MMQRADYYRFADTRKRKIFIFIFTLSLVIRSPYQNKNNNKIISQTWMSLFCIFFFFFFIPKFNLKSRQKVKWFHLRWNSVRWSLNLRNGKHNNYSSGKWNHFPHFDNNNGQWVSFTIYDILVIYLVPPFWCHDFHCFVSMTF